MMRHTCMCKTNGVKSKFVKCWTLKIKRFFHIFPINSCDLYKVYTHLYCTCKPKIYDIPVKMFRNEFEKRASWNFHLMSASFYLLTPWPPGGGDGDTSWEILPFENSARGTSKRWRRLVTCLPAGTARSEELTRAKRTGRAGDRQQVSRGGNPGAESSWWELFAAAFWRKRARKCGGHLLTFRHLCTSFSHLLFFILLN